MNERFTAGEKAAILGTILGHISEESTVSLDIPEFSDGVPLRFALRILSGRKNGKDIVLVTNFDMGKQRPVPESGDFHNTFVAVYQIHGTLVSSPGTLFNVDRERSLKEARSYSELGDLYLFDERADDDERVLPALEPGLKSTDPVMRLKCLQTAAQYHLYIGDFGAAEQAAAVIETGIAALTEENVRAERTIELRLLREDMRILMQLERKDNTEERDSQTAPRDSRKTEGSPDTSP